MEKPIYAKSKADGRKWDDQIEHLKNLSALKCLHIELNILHFSLISQIANANIPTLYETSRERSSRPLKASKRRVLQIVQDLLFKKI